MENEAPPDLPSPQRWREISRVLDAALDAAPAERPALLDEACAGDPELRREVEAYLDAEADAPDVLEHCATDFLAGAGEVLAAFEAHADQFEAQADQGLADGRRVGPYRLTGRIGRGGMSTVYRAERADGQFTRTVAVKVLRGIAGLDPADLRRRFEAERQILASLSHPHVAQVFDSGVIEEEGRPYLVMEYIEGRPITAHCEDHQLGLEARLRLFDQVAGAVQHAHQNMVVHRDLKPSNILVTPEGAPRLFDFGIAKLLEVAVADDDEAPQTRTGALLMTPAYAAPEQVRSGDITAATDTYALGVLLYELLTGQRPYEIEAQNPLEMTRVVCEERPPRPSTAARKRANNRANANADANANDDDEEARPWMPSASALRGDLDAIVMRALRKEPERRYRSVEALRDDLERYRAGRPVAARRGTWRYRAGKFARRYRWQIAAVAAFVGLLVAYAATATVQSRRLAAERDRAEQSAERAKQSAERAEATAAFLKNVLAISDPEKGQGGDVPARVLLRKGAARLDTSFADQPALKADLKGVIGSAFRGYGLYEEALGLHRDALRLHLANGDSTSRAVADTRNNIGEIFYYLDRPDAARAQYRRSLQTRRRLLGPQHVAIAQSLNNLALLDARRGDYSRAADRLKKALAIFRNNLPDDHWRIANVLSNLALQRNRQGALAKAERRYRQALAMLRRVKGDEHRDVARTHANLGSILAQRGKLAEADTILREALRRVRDVTVESLPLEAYTLFELGELRRRQQRFAAAERRYRRARERYRQALPPGHRRQMNALIGLGEAMLAQGRAAEARPHARQAVKIGEEALRPEHRVLAEARSLLGACRSAEGRYAEAERSLQEARNALRPPKTPQAAQALRRVRERLARLYEAWGKPEPAAAWRDSLTAPGTLPAGG